MNTINLMAIFQVIYVLQWNNTKYSKVLFQWILLVSSLKTAAAVGLDGKSNFQGRENTLFFKIGHVY